MLNVLNVSSLDELTKQVVPSDILLDKDLDLTPAVSENAYLANLKAMVAKNKNFRSLIGGGYFGTGAFFQVLEARKYRKASADWCGWKI